MAKEKGYFRDAGLPEVKIQWRSKGDSSSGPLAKGEIDFCTGWLAQMIVARTKGQDVVNVAQIMQTSALMLVTRRSSGIRKPRDLDGKRVGLWGGGLDIQPRAFFSKLGIKPNVIMQSYSMVPFLRGAVDAASAMRYNEYHMLLEAGLREDELCTFLLADHGMDFPEDGIYCTAATRRDRAKECSALVSACLKGWAYAFAHEAETLDIVMKNCDRAHVSTNRNHQRWMLREMAAFVQHRVGPDPARWGALTRSAYEHVANTLRDQKLIESPPLFEELYRPAVPAKQAGP